MFPSPLFSPKKTSLLTNIPKKVGRLKMDNSQKTTIRKRHNPPPALGRNRQRQPGKKRPVPRQVEAPPRQLLLRLRPLLDPGQELLGPIHHLRREVGSL